jgi:uracil-DNA glycosylase family 4
MISMDTSGHEHYCEDIDNFPVDKFLQKGIGKGKKLLVVGESPAPNGWRKSGKACYTPEGKLLPTGQRLNELLEPHELSVDVCGFTELAKCHIGKDRKLLLSCSEKCWPIFLEQVELVNSKLILLLGIKTLEIFNKISESVLQVGEIVEIKLGNSNLLILPIYHPSPINPYGRSRNKSIFKQSEKMLQELL